LNKLRIIYWVDARESAEPFTGRGLLAASVQLDRIGVPRLVPLDAAWRTNQSVSQRSLRVAGVLTPLWVICIRLPPPFLHQPPMGIRGWWRPLTRFV